MFRIDVKAEYDQDEKAWVVHLQRGNQELKTFLDDGDAEKCMLGEQCVGLGIMVAQLQANIEELVGEQTLSDPSVCTKAPELAEHQRFDLALVGHVRDLGQDASSGCGNDLCPSVLQGGLVPPADHDIAAFVAQTLR